MDDTQIEMLPMLGEFSSIASQYEHIMFYYESGIQQIVAKLQILNNEFKNNHERNPIENIKSRVKSLDSIIDKMKRKGIPLTTNAMKREIKDIAGVRVICPFISDVYQVANMLVNQADVEIVTIKDYIKKPKENGYRSLHMIVLVDVYFSDHKDKVPIEIQFRTIAMNFWPAQSISFATRRAVYSRRRCSRSLRNAQISWLTLMTRCRIWPMFRGLCSRLSKRE